MIMKTTRDIKNKPFKSAGIEQTCFDNSLKSIIRDELPAGNATAGKSKLA